MKRTFISLACFLAPFVSLLPVTAQTQTVPLGVNINEPIDWMPDCAFVDAFKEARPPFGVPAGVWINTCQVGTDGWPIEDFSVIIMIAANGAVPVQDISGTYHLSFNGRATISPVACAFTVQNQVYTSDNNVTVADVVVPAGQTQIIIAFTNTVGETSHIKFIRPPYPADTTQEFTTNYLNAIAPFSVLRCMDYLDANNEVAAQTPTAANNWGWGFTCPPGFPNTASFTGSVSLPVRTWATRHVPTDPFQQDFPNPPGSVLKNAINGASYEYLIDLANQTNKDLWVNIPIDATDDYVTQLATLFKNNLKSNLHVYVEYSNEIWNSSFPQYGWNLIAAQNEYNTGNSKLSYDGDTNIWDWGARRAAKRLMQISNLFKNVYGPAAINTTIRPVFAWQVSGYGQKLGLDYINFAFGPPNQYFYATAQAPYFGADDYNGTPGSDTSSVTVPELLTELNNDSNATYAQNTALRTVATWYGLHCVTYEGGPGLGSSADAANDLAAGTDPGITPIIEHALDANWYAAGGELFMYYDLANIAPTPWSWGLTSNITNLQTPKFEAINGVLATPAPVVTAGTALPSVAGQSVTITSLNSYQHPTADWDSYYLLNVPASGPYSLSMAVGGTYGGGVYGIGQVDNGVTLNISWPTNAGNTTPVTLSLGQGLHVLRLGVRGGGGATSSLTLTKSALAQAPNLLSAATRMTHGTAGNFDIPMALTGSAGIECRKGPVAGSYNLVLTFDSAVASGTGTVTWGTGVAGVPVCSGTTMTIPLTGVANAQELTVNYSNVLPQGGGAGASGAVTCGFLIGDVNGDGAVTSTDILPIKAAYGTTGGSTGFNMRADLNCDGVVSTTDILPIKQYYGTVLP